MLTGRYPCATITHERKQLFLSFEDTVIRKSVTIIVWTAVWLAIVLFGAFVGEQYLPGDSSSLASWERTLVEFDHRLLNYLLYGSRANAVIIGPSYAAGLGEFGLVANLALRSTNIEEHAKILSFCRKSDTVIYMITIREMILRNRPVRPELGNYFRRRLRIHKFLLLDLLSPDSATLLPDYGEPYGPQDPEYMMLCDAARSSSVPRFPRSMIGLQLSYIVCEKEPCSDPLIDIQPLLALQEIHPDILFVLSPVLPLYRIEPTCEFASKINRYADNQEAFESAMLGSGLPVLNLSYAVPASFFMNLNHLTEEGNTLMRQMILDALARGHAESPS